MDGRGILSGRIFAKLVDLLHAFPTRGTATGLHFVPISIADDDSPLRRYLDAAVSSLAGDPAGSAVPGLIEVEIDGSLMVENGRVDLAVAAAMLAALGRVSIGSQN